VSETRCEYCGRFISDNSLDKLYKGDTSECDGKMTYTNYPQPEPDREVFWHIDCKKSNDDRISDFMNKNNRDEREDGI